MNVGPLFGKLMDCEKKIVILQGGGDAGKTVTALQYLGTLATQEKAHITVTGQDLPNLKDGALKNFQDYALPDLQPYIESFNKTDSKYFFINGSVIHFKSFGSEQDAKGGERQYLFVNEANGVDYQIFWQLQRKTRKKVIIDYNPNSMFWAHSKIMGLVEGEMPEKQFHGKWQRYIIDHRHNPFLSEEDHTAYESISDPDMFRVYSRGLTGKIKGLILGHFKKIQLHEMPTEYDRLVIGEDYGFTNDPSAIVLMYVKGRQRFFRKLCYETGLSADHLIALKRSNGWNPNIPIYGDSGNDGGIDMINQQRLKGMPVQPAIKGPGSIIAGISKLREYECFYVDDKDFDFEISNYKWVMARDVLTGKDVMTNIPVDSYNHICDACRYAAYTDSIRNRC